MIGRHDDGDDWVPARRRVIGQQQDRLALVRDLQRARGHALAQQLARRGRGAAAARSAAVRSGCWPGSRRSCRVASASRAAAANQSSRGPAITRSSTGPCAGGTVVTAAGGRAAAAFIRQGTGPSQRQPVAGPQWPRPKTRQAVRRPAAEHRRDRDAAVDRDVAAQPGRRRAEPEHGPGRDRERRAVPLAQRARASPAARLAGPGRARRRPRPPRRASNRSASRPRVTSRQAAPASFPTRWFASRRLPASAAPLAGTPRCAEPGPAEILDGRERARLQHFDPPQARGSRRCPSRPSSSRSPCPPSAARAPAAGCPTARNRTRMPGASSAGGSRSGSQSGAVVRPSSRQPPGDAAG